ncbi:hypothetical protein N7481_010164 [Penicillium waksmanii]|uniref:uncharacterized protein n=1 Tax=Penicillium waksmanii TaxID=69791 RepID=UPI002548130E|nr:uncharacterized protein N7481_010164 [Penicillium waksmanii]KAJ5976457.1 hypothetical protein N7481_010164 [Penicillium waksmanii]
MSTNSQAPLMLPPARIYARENATLTRENTDGPSNDKEDQYLGMLKEEDQMDATYNITASAANWALLAGYLVIPGTFASLQTSKEIEHVLTSNKTGRVIFHTIQNPPLLGIACLFLASGIAAMLWLLHFPHLRGNYVWLTNKIFMPVTLNAGAGLLTTLINVFASNRGVWSVMAIVTTVVTGATFIIFLAVLLVYKLYKLPPLNGQRIGLQNLPPGRTEDS